ncbi:hypothetical protein [Polaromonas sp. UC242_47]|uniref:hypothetical protein n=1 Tax=Polaromonas sp. UC242_47 TaxID=3374626 RepID=UPI0037BC7D91
MDKTHKAATCGGAALSLAVVLGIGSAAAQTPIDAGAPALQARYTNLATQLARSPFQRPLVIDSSESTNAISGNAYAVINYPFATVNAAFKNPDNWCEVLMLHLNTKHCRTDDAGNPAVLRVSIGKKQQQDIKDAYPLAFNFTPLGTTPDYVAVQLNADQGPLGTHNYRINLKAVPIAGGKTFMHLQYSYGYGVAGRLAMQTYLATLGSGKVGFTLQEPQPGGPKNPVNGMRGAVERNTMRYYLAIDAYMASMAVPAAEQLEKRLQHWFDATERYPRQLHEIDRTTYLAMKHKEYLRQPAPR